MLKDLSLLKEEVKTEIATRLPEISELRFSTFFGRRFSEICDWNISFFKHTAKIVTGERNYVFASSQWFYVAAKLIPFYKELRNYIRLIEDGVSNLGIAQVPSDQFREWTDDVRNNRQEIPRALFDHFAEQDLNEAEQGYLRNFLTNYRWWSGGKAIGRTQGDSLNSPLMYASNLLNESSGYVPSIVKILYQDNMLTNDIILTAERKKGINEFVIESSNANDFVRDVFNHLEDAYHERLVDSLEETGEARIGAVTYMGIKAGQISNAFAKSPEVFTEEQLTSGNSLRFYVTPILRHEDNNYYLSTKWGDSSENSHNIKNLTRYLLKYFDFIRILKKSNLYVAYYEKNDFNRIIYGAPGTGKSYLLNSQIPDDRTIRVTFNPEYTYGQFIGSYKPVVRNAGTEEERITYDLVRGPFLEALIKAFRTNRPVYLIVEEINRANVSAVFGDVFQLLDRDESGEGEYGIRFNSDIQGHLLNEGIIHSLDQEVKLPSNLYLWATMNSADQGVYPMDTAFKRRWKFEYLDINTGQSHIEGKMMRINDEGVLVEWNKLRTAINIHLSAKDIQEDKLLGAFFISENEMDDVSSFAGKLLIYLWDDVLRHNNRTILFRNKSLSSLRKSINEARTTDQFLRNAFSDSFLENSNLFQAEPEQANEEAG